MNTINIMGTCCSRFIFNYPPINGCFKVNRYAFQTAVWNSFDNSLGLNLDVNDIEKVETAPFTRRMINYEFNNITVSEMDKYPSDYFMMDLMIMPLPLYKISYKEHITYTHNISLGSTELPQMVKMPEFEGLTYEKISIEDIPEGTIKSKLDIFCNWALNNYPSENIIIYRPKRGKKYIISSSGELKEYSDKEIDKFLHYDNIVKKYTDYVKAKLPDSIYFECDDDVIAYDANCLDRKPAAYHYSGDTYTQHSKELLKLIQSRKNQ